MRKKHKTEPEGIPKELIPFMLVCQVQVIVKAPGKIAARERLEKFLEKEGKALAALQEEYGIAGWGWQLLAIGSRPEDKGSNGGSDLVIAKNVLVDKDGNPLRQN